VAIRSSKGLALSHAERNSRGDWHLRVGNPGSAGRSTASLHNVVHVHCLRCRWLCFIDGVSITRRELHKVLPSPKSSTAIAMTAAAAVSSSMPPLPADGGHEERLSGTGQNVPSASWAEIGLRDLLNSPCRTIPYLSESEATVLCRCT